MLSLHQFKSEHNVVYWKEVMLRHEKNCNSVKSLLSAGQHLISISLHISMQCWWSLLLHPFWQLVKLSPSTISSKHMGHTSSSSRAWGSNPARPDVLGVDGGVLLWPRDREFFNWPSFCKRDVTRAWNLESKFSTLTKIQNRKKKLNTNWSSQISTKSHLSIIEWIFLTNKLDQRGKSYLKVLQFQSP